MMRALLLALVPLALGDYSYDYTDAPTAVPTATEDGGITAMITPSPPAPSSVHSPIAARRSTRLLVVPTYRSDLV